MARSRWFVGFAIAASACYEVGDLRHPTADAAGGAANAGGAAGTGWGASAGTSGAGGGGGAGAPSEAGSEAAPEDASSDVSESGPVDAAQEPATGTWKSCKALGYEGDCVGSTTVLFYLAPNDCGVPAKEKCIVNQCSKQGGQCALDNCSGGTACYPDLVLGQEDACAAWGTDGACVDNVAIKRDGVTENCLYKDCTELGDTCVDGATTPADCF